MNYIGIDLGGTNIKGALVSAEGEILKEHSIPTHVDLGPEVDADIVHKNALPGEMCPHCMPRRRKMQELARGRKKFLKKIIRVKLFGRFLV